jgi:hypothetical protein
MPGQTPAFKRLVLGLQAGPSARAIRAAAEFASLLNLELMGLFFQDTRLEKLSGIPFVRELRLLGGGWQPIDIDRLSRDFELAARNAERLLASEATQFSTKWQFEVTRELFSEAFGALSRASDIVMIVQPESPAAEYATRQFPLLMEAALLSAPAVMLAPAHPSLRTGPVIAIAAIPNDPCIYTAAEIAIAAKEELVIIGAGAGDESAAVVRELEAGPPLQIRSVRGGESLLSSLASLSSLLDQLKGRFLVFTRGVAPLEALLRAGVFRRISVLAVEPPDTMPEEVRSPS